MKRVVTLLLSLMAVTVGLVAQSPVALPSSKIKWGPAPPALPAGGQMAALNGDPGKDGNYTITGKFPDGYVFPPHSHPAEENVFVMSGTLLVGMGDTFNESTLVALPAGSYAFMPKGTRHYARTKGETTIVVYGPGPFDLAYANANDDPRNKKR